MLWRIRNQLTSALAVDLGTANTVVAMPGAGVVLDEPSLVAIEEGSRRILARGAAIGRLAKQLIGRVPGSIQVVSPLAGGVITDFELCEAMLRSFLRKARRQRFGLRPRLLITAPGCITPVEKRALFTSAHRAGASEVYLLSQAKAAALGAGLPLGEPVAQMICDIGAGTTETAIFSLGEEVASQSLRVGGQRFDDALVCYLRRHYSLRVGLGTAERLRIDAGSAVPLEVETSVEVRGVDTVSGLPRKAQVTSEEVRESLAEPLEQIVEALRQTLDRCPPDLAADLVDQGFVLSGGGGLLTGLDEYLHQRTGLPVRRPAEPLSVVARGALVCLENFEQWRSSLESSRHDV